MQINIIHYPNQAANACEFQILAIQNDDLYNPIKDIALSKNENQILFTKNSKYQSQLKDEIIINSLND